MMEIYLDNMPKIEVLLGITKKEWFEIDNIDFQEETFDVLAKWVNRIRIILLVKLLELRRINNERKSIQ